MTAPAGPRWAVTLFSFTNELLTRRSEPDVLLASVLRSGVADVVEIDGAQHLRSFPLVDPAEAARTADVVAVAGARVSVLGGGADVSPSPGALLDAGAALAQLASQLGAARVLGAEALRIPFGVLPWSVLAAAAEVAGREGVLLLEEVQGPLAAAGPPLEARLAELSASGTPWVRLLLDASALMSGLPPTYVAALRAEGLPGSDVDRLAEAFARGRVGDVVVPRLGDPDLTPAVRGLLITAMTRFGSAAASEWLPLASWIAGVHLKWWDLESAAADLTGETGALLDGLVAAGFSGTVCSEWGGHEWLPSSVDALAWTAEHRSLVEARIPALAGGAGFRAGSTYFSTKAT